MQRYDLIVIGTGEAGKTVARAGIQAGKSTAIIDRQPYGGTCSQRGCDPKKVLVTVAQALDRAQRLQGLGLTSVPTHNWADLMQFKRTFTEPIPENTERDLRKVGIELYHGEARFISPHRLEVDGHTLEGHEIVIATGAMPRPLDFSGKTYAWDSATFLDMDTLPNDIVFIGGGYIALEFAHVACRFGSQVTIIERGERILDPFEVFVTEHLAQASRDMGIRILTDTEISSIEKKGYRYTIHAKQGEQKLTLTTDQPFHAAGRVPAIAALDLAKAGVDCSDKGVQVDAYLQTSQPHIYACGDVTDRDLPLTPTAVAQGEVVVQNLIKGKKVRADFPTVPTNVYTIPTMGAVGLTEAQAKEAGISYTIRSGDVSDWSTARRLNGIVYAYKIILDQQEEKVLGAHILGPHAAETINIFALAMANDLNVADIDKVLFSYPSSVADIKSMLDK